MTGRRPLPWGRRYLMCPPTHFEVAYAINPWMALDEPVDRDRACRQWDGLVALLRRLGAEVEVLDPVEGLPDLVFTANAGVVDGDVFVPSRFRHRERQGETPHVRAWFGAHGYRVLELPPGVSHEGAGEALPFGGEVVAGFRWRSDEEALAPLAERTGAVLHPVELVDERFYHLDLTFCPLDDRSAITVPDAWGAAGRRRVDALVPEQLPLTLAEAAQFTANAVVVGTTVVMTACPPRVGRQLRAWGFDVVVADVSEFQKAGGGVRCLTLSLDVEV